MSRFNVRGAAPTATSPVASEQVAGGTTYEGAPAFARNGQSELFLLAISTMTGSDEFYENAAGRDQRLNALVAQVAPEGPEWMRGFLPWLRLGANMRTASLVAALETARAMVAAKVPGSRQMVSSVLQRADEPGEGLAYWTSRYGRKLPKPVKEAS